MTKINQELLDRLGDRLGIKPARLYDLIRKISADNRVPRHLGALLLAGDNGISIQKYAGPGDLAELRNTPHHSPIITSEPSSNTRAAPRRSTKPSKTKENTVFVVHGRDNKLRDSIYQLLGALGLRVLEWGHAIKAARAANPYVNEAVTKIMEQAQAIVVMRSPDDEAKLKQQFLTRDDAAAERKLLGQARQNVTFETGIAVGTHHRKTLIVEVGQVKPFTDIGGMHILKLSNSPASRHEFVERLEGLGCKVNRDGNHWLRAGDFTPTKQKIRKAKPPVKRRR
jgi:predicted nucleotide-binding protein